MQTAGACVSLGYHEHLRGNKGLLGGGLAASPARASRLALCLVPVWGSCWLPSLTGEVKNEVSRWGSASSGMSSLGCQLVLDSLERMATSSILLGAA